MSQNQNDIVLDKVLKSTKLLAPDDVDEPITKEKEPLTEVQKVAAEYKEYGVDWTGNDTLDKTEVKENPIDAMFNKARKGIY